MRMKDVKKAVGSRMKAAAVAMGWAAKDVALQIGGDEKAVAHWFAGRRLPPEKRMDAYADLVGLDAGAFYGEHLITEDVGEALIGVSGDDWLRLTEEERSAVRVTVRAFVELHRREEGASQSSSPAAE